MPNTLLKFDHQGLISSVPTTPDGKIHRYTMPFNDNDPKTPQFAEYNNLYQAQQMLANFKEIIKENPNAKIAITYSANETQADQLIAGYTNNTDQSAILAGGANQAAVFHELLKLLNEEPKLKNHIHILPIATMPAGNGEQPASEANVKKCMENIAKHLGAGWIVLGLSNQHTSPRSYAIGGGIATGWQKSDQKQLCDKTLIFMTNQSLTDDTIDIIEDRKYLIDASVDGQQSPDSLLIPLLDQMQPDVPQPTEPAFDVGSDLMQKVTPEDWNRAFKTEFKPETTQERIKQGYRGTISVNNEDLVHITDKGLICPEVKDKQKQADIIAESLKLIKEKNNIPEDQPLIVKANNFSVNDLEIIIAELKKQKINIQFDTEGEKDENIKNLIKTNGMLYQLNTETPPTKANHPEKDPILPTLTTKAPTKKKSEEEYKLVDVASDGNCLFASIIHQLDTRKLNTNAFDQQSLRENIADYISAHWDGGKDRIIFKNFVREQEQQAAGINPPKNPEAFTTEDKNKYIAYIKRDKIWGDQASIIAASKILHINIAIKTEIGGQHNKTYPNPPDSNKSTIYLWHEPEIHYKSYFAKDDLHCPKTLPKHKM